MEVEQRARSNYLNRVVICYNSFIKIVPINGENDEVSADSFASGPEVTRLLSFPFPLGPDGGYCILREDPHVKKLFAKERNR